MIANGVANSSTCTEWSITSSEGSSGLTLLALPPSSAMALRIAARSTIAGTPVKSWWSTRPGRNEIAFDGSADATHPATASTSSVVIVTPSSCRRTFSSRIRSVYGRR